MQRKKGVETDNGFEDCSTAKISGKPFFVCVGILNGMMLLVKWIFNVIFWEPNVCFIDMRL